MGYSSSTTAGPLRKQPGVQAAWVKPVLYGALNIASASGIVFANKAVFSTYGFKFTCALTWIHTLFTLVGMRLFLMAGIFPYKKLPQLKLLPLAAAYVGYIVLCNLSLNVNTVGFYQVMKVGHDGFCVLPQLVQLLVCHAHECAKAAARMLAGAQLRARTMRITCCSNCTVTNNSRHIVGPTDHPLPLLIPSVPALPADCSCAHSHAAGPPAIPHHPTSQDCLSSPGSVPWHRHSNSYR